MEQEAGRHHTPVIISSCWFSAMWTAKREGGNVGGVSGPGAGDVSGYWGKKGEWRLLDIKEEGLPVGGEQKLL